MTSRQNLRSHHICSVFSALGLMFCASCVKPTINFGTSFVSNNNTNIVVVDTFSVKMSTVFVDSVPSAGTGSILVGRFKDNYFGVITAKSYFQVSPPRGIASLVIDPNAVYDSLVLITRVNKTFYGDTSIPQRFVVSQLSTTIQYPGTQTTFFSNDSIPYDMTPLGYADALILPLKSSTSQLNNDSLKIKLPDAQGQDIFNRMLVKDPSVINANSFLAYFRGFAMYPADNSAGGLYGFRDTAFMRLYYHSPGVVPQLKFADFSLYQKSYQFNHITADRTGTPLQALSNMKPPVVGISPEISSDSTGHAAYLQGITGMQVKLRFPSLWKLAQLPNYVSILKAELFVRPIGGTYSPELAMPPRVGIYTTDEKNFLGLPLIAGGQQFGNLNVDYIYGNNTVYTYDLTNYLKNQILGGPLINETNGLMLSVPNPDYNTNFNRTVLGDGSNSINNQILLKIYYASFY